MIFVHVKAITNRNILHLFKIYLHENNLKKCISVSICLRYMYNIHYFWSEYKTNDKKKYYIVGTIQ